MSTKGYHQETRVLRRRPQCSRPPQRWEAGRLGVGARQAWPSVAGRRSSTITITGSVASAAGFGAPTVSAIAEEGPLAIWSARSGAIRAGVARTAFSTAGGGTTHAMAIIGEPRSTAPAIDRVRSFRRRRIASETKAPEAIRTRIRRTVTVGNASVRGTAFPIGSALGQVSVEVTRAHQETGGLTLAITIIPGHIA